MNWATDRRGQNKLLAAWKAAQVKTAIVIGTLPTADRLVGLVVKASASRAEGPGFESRLRRDFFRGRVIPVT